MRKLREFAIAQGMQWVLDEIDEAIALGVPETRTLRQTTRQGFTSYEDVTEPDELFSIGQGPSRRHRRSEEFVRSRPMDPLEQVQLLLQALRRVLVDLEAVAVGCLDALDPATLSEYADPGSKSALTGFAVPSIATITFAPDEGSTAPGISIDFIRESQRRSRVIDVLDEIETEIEIDQ